MAADWIPLQINLEKTREVQNITDAIQIELKGIYGQRPITEGTLSPTNADNVGIVWGQHKVLEAYIAHDRMKIKRYVCGLLHAFWGFFNQNSVDGRIENMSLNAVDSEVGHEGFCKLLIEQGWLEQDGKSLVMPNFDVFNGDSFKLRAKEAQKKRTGRRNAAKNGKGKEGTLSPAKTDTVPKKRGPIEQNSTEENTNTKDKAGSALGDSLKEPKPKAKAKVIREELIAIPLPATHNTPAIRTAFNEFIDNRIETRKPPTQLAVRKLIEILASQKPEYAVPMLNKAIAAGWTSLYPLNESDVKSLKLPPAEEKKIPPEHRKFPPGGAINARPTN